MIEDMLTLHDWISSFSDLLVAIAATVAVWQGIKSLSAWRHEAIGRRRIELAEEVLADFYEAWDIIRWVRTPFTSSEESRERPGRDDEPEELRGFRDPYYTPIKRIGDHAEFFAKMRARRYRVIATFGTEAAKPYDAIHKIRIRIAHAAQSLMTPARGSDNERTNLRRERWEADIWDGAEDKDEISTELDGILKEVERRFRSEIDSSLGAVRPATFGRAC
jgi:hypothetical protein